MKQINRFVQPPIFVFAIKFIHRLVKPIVFLSVLLIWGIVGILPSGIQPAYSQASSNLSLRLYGNGTGFNDRVEIRIDPHVPADIGATNFTLEWWMKAALAENSSPGASCGSEASWITGNILLDRDIWGGGDYGDLGISVTSGKIAFGVSKGSSGNTICGSRTVANGAWHHVAVTRNQSSGQLRIFVDGVLDVEGSGPTGNVSYRNGRSTSFSKDPFLVIGAEKHDYDSNQYPSYSGWMDELRISNTIRYTANFVPPTVPFIADANTAVLFHFNEGPVGACQGTIVDSSGATGGPSSGTCRYGGNPAGPVYSADTPFTAPQNTPTRNSTPAVSTNTPTATLSAPQNSPTPTRTPTATISVTQNTPTHTPTSTQVTTGMTDDFTRSDSTNLGTNWTERSGNWQIFSNTLRNASTGGDAVVTYAGTYNNVQVSSDIHFSNAAGTITIGTRLGAFADGIPNAGYAAELSPTGQIILWRVDTWAQLSSYQIAGYQATQPNTLTLFASGSDIRVNVNGVERINVTNTAFTSGSIGLWSYNASAANQHIMDNFTLVILP